MPRPKRTLEETWKVIDEQAAEEAEIDRFLAMPREEVDARVRADGHDPAAIREKGAALASRLLADRDRLAWQIEPARELAREQARVDAIARARRYAALSRDELLARIALARNDPRFSAPVAVLFRNRKPEESSEDELRSILEEIDGLAEREEQ